MKIDWTRPIRHTTGAQVIRVIGSVNGGAGYVVVYKYRNTGAEYVTVVDDSCVWIENVPSEKKTYFQAVYEQKGNVHPGLNGNLFETCEALRAWVNKNKGTTFVKLIGIVKVEVELEHSDSG